MTDNSYRRVTHTIRHPDVPIRVAGHILTFSWVNHPRRGWQFHCDENGNVDETTLTPEGAQVLAACRRGICAGIHVEQGVINTYRVPDWTGV